MEGDSYGQKASQVNVVINYASNDGLVYVKKLIEKFDEVSRKLNFVQLNVSYDAGEIYCGELFENVMKTYIDNSDIGVLCITPAVKNSQYVAIESNYMREQGKKIIPILFSDFGDIPSYALDTNAIRFDSPTFVEQFAEIVKEYISTQSYNAGASSKMQADISEAVSELKTKNPYKTVVFEAVKKGVSIAVEKIIAKGIILVVLALYILYFSCKQKLKRFPVLQGIVYEVNLLVGKAWM